MNRPIAFGSSDAAKRRFSAAAKVSLWIALVLVLLYLFQKLYPLTQPEATAEALRNDFVVFWAAGKLAFAGEPLAAFDHQRLLAAAQLSPGVDPPNLNWYYPATFQILMMPFGALPYAIAFPLFIAISAIVYCLVLRQPASVLPSLWRFLIASPAVLVGGLTIGQTSVLWTAGLVAGLWAIRGGKPAAAGLAFALLTMKPQLGVLLPIALIASRQWAVIGWGALFTVLLNGLATAFVGADYWPMFVGGLSGSTMRVADGTMFLYQMPSPYGFMREIGAGHGPALIPQAIATLTTAAIIAWIWSRRTVAHDLKCATLCTGILLAMPYAFYYECVLLLAAGLFLLRDGFGQSLTGKAWLVVLWLGTAPPIILQTTVPPSLYMPPVILVTMAVCLMRAIRSLPPRSEPPQSTGSAV